MNGKKVVVGLSGGVDSSVAAALLIEQGYDVHGVYLECYNEPGCRTDQDKADALKVALSLGISFEVLDFRNEYREKVVEYFYREYEAGRTPNPDVMCNREIKFGIFYDWALRQAQGKPRYDYVATGHYARISYIRESVNPSLQRAHDESKDQSYFLWQIPSDHLSHILFPLGAMLKSEVREKAKELGLPTASKPDSMGICFIGEVDVSKLLRERLGEKMGEVIMRASHVSPLQEFMIGGHKGLWFHTIGERKGLELDKSALKKLGMHPEKMTPLYVIGKNQEKNQLIVGTREETMVDNFTINSQTRLAARQVLKLGRKLWVRIRNLGELVEVESLSDLSGGESSVVLKEKVFGVAAGQSAVFYDDERVMVGGGVIIE